MNPEQWLPLITNLAITYTTKIVMAILVLVVGLWITRMLGSVIKRSLEHSQIDSSLKPFMLNLSKVSLKVLLLISTASILGIETTSFVALLGSASLAVGLALQGSLSNFAGSVLILMFKPFRVGDIIQVQGHLGTVKEIQTFSTVLLTPDHKTIILPNGGLAGGSLVNLSRETTRRLDFVLKVSQKHEVQKIRQSLLELLQTVPECLPTPPPTVLVTNIGETSYEITLSMWVKTEVFITQHATLTAVIQEKILNYWRKEIE